MTLDPASLETAAADLDAMGGGPDLSGPRWWTLRSQSLEILATGTWRVMATLTARGRSSLVELHLEVDLKASRGDRLVLRGRGVLDRQAFGMGKRTWILDPEIQLELAVHATQRHEQATLHGWPMTMVRGAAVRGGQPVAAGGSRSGRA